MALGADVAHLEPTLITLPLRSEELILGCAEGPDPAAASAESDRSAEFRTVIAQRLEGLQATDNSGRDWTGADFLGHWTLLGLFTPPCGAWPAEWRRLAEARRDLARAQVAVVYLAFPADPQAVADGAPVVALPPGPRLTMSPDELARWTLPYMPANILVAPDGQPVALDIHGPGMVAEIIGLAAAGRKWSSTLPR